MFRTTYKINRYELPKVAVSQKVYSQTMRNTKNTWSILLSMGVINRISKELSGIEK